LPDPVVAVKVTIRIHTGWLILFMAVPKSTVTFVLANKELPVVITAGTVVTVVKADGDAPMPKSTNHVATLGDATSNDCKLKLRVKPVKPVVFANCITKAALASAKAALCLKPITLSVLADCAAVLEEEINPSYDAEFLNCPVAVFQLVAVVVKVCGVPNAEEVAPVYIEKPAGKPEPALSKFWL
jgi:hypothetical protein